MVMKKNINKKPWDGTTFGAINRIKWIMMSSIHTLSPGILIGGRPSVSIFLLLFFIIYIWLDGAPVALPAFLYTIPANT